MGPDHHRPPETARSSGPDLVGTMLAQWHAAAGAGRVAWVSLDEGDNDPTRFRTYLVEALRTVEPDLGTAALQALQRTSVHLERAVLPSLLNDLNALSSPLFLVPLDDRREWYRYHQLFRELLQLELADREPKLVPALHRRAAAWHRRAGNLDKAIDHATAAGDFTEANALVAAQWLGYWRRRRRATLARWLDGLPEERAQDLTERELAVLRLLRPGSRPGRPAGSSTSRPAPSGARSSPSTASWRRRAEPRRCSGRASSTCFPGRPRRAQSGFHLDESRGWRRSPHTPRKQDPSVMPGPRASGAVEPTIYQIVVRGELSQRFLLAFEGMTLASGEGQTAITGPVVDQAHLHGLLNRVADLGLELVSVNPSQEPSSSTPYGRSRR